MTDRKASAVRATASANRSVAISSVKAIADKRDAIPNIVPSVAEAVNEINKDRARSKRQ
ncbi:hypothetical protein PPOP_2540 [Paenibacillus popilliae ATCC 14706]|uniref:Uncharacterized protein n=1 Tax=Paenibacillus popilliae ATCC 14706 TaxID=1212764 RepID=M9M6M1_PAEPP|nr:hypothetical protein PPOP_2540 [Paenibacillus popilliae ATCC 14706]